MTKLKEILLVGTKFNHPSADWDVFYTKKHFSDFRVVIIDPQGAFEGPDYEHRVVDNVLTFNHEPGKTFDKRFHKITQKLVKHVNEGGVAIVIVRYLPHLNYVDYNSIGNRDDRNYDLNESLPWGDCPIIEGHGSNVEVTKGAKGGPLEAFWNASGDIWAYEAVFADEIKASVAQVLGRPDEIVSFSIITDGAGFCLMTPVPDFSWLDEKERPDSIKSFLDEVIVLETLINTPLEKVDVPKWTSNFLLAGEAEKIEAIKGAQQEIKRLQRGVIEKNNNLQDTRRMKLLFSGYDTPLEKAVDMVLTELGLTVTPGKRGRVDRIAEFGEKIFAIEVQGVKKSAKEDHARSLIQWVQEVAIERKVEPKGLFVVNAYREADLTERTGDLWVGKIPEICKRQEFCQVTGLQLLGIYLDVRDNPEKKEEIIERLFSTVGPLDGYNDWKSFITKAPEEKTDESDGKE